MLQRLAMATFSAFANSSRGGIILFALFALAGVLLVDDYGVAFDESVQRTLAAATAGYS